MLWCCCGWSGLLWAGGVSWLLPFLMGCLVARLAPGLLGGSVPCCVWVWGSFFCDSHVIIQDIALVFFMFDSLFAGVVSVGFSGSRSPSPAASAALAALLPLVPSGARVSVGCAHGVDASVRGFFVGSPSLLVFSVASGRFGVGRAAFARRSSRCVLSVAAGSRGLLVALPSAPVPPAGCRVRRSWCSGGSGTWGTAALALGRGRRVLLWLPSGCLPPAWSGVSWSSPGAFGSAGCWWLGVPAAVPSASAPVQLSLF